MNTEKALSVLGVPVYMGYAPTHAEPPYVVYRIMTQADGEHVSVCGGPYLQDVAIGVYCCAASYEASVRLGLDASAALRSGMGHPITLSTGYNGAQVGGLYETQITMSTMKEV